MACLIVVGEVVLGVNGVGGGFARRDLARFFGGEGGVEGRCSAGVADVDGGFFTSGGLPFGMKSGIGFSGFTNSTANVVGCIAVSGGLSGTLSERPRMVVTVSNCIKLVRHFPVDGVGGVWWV